MTLRIKQGTANLLSVGGSLANAAECCCCNCTQLRFLNNCECLNADYGPNVNYPDAQITLTEVGIPLIIQGKFSTCTGPTAPDMSGTYVVPCNSNVTYEHWVYACTLTRPEDFNPSDIYYRSVLEIGWNPFLTDITFHLTSTAIAVSVGFPNPYPAPAIRSQQLGLPMSGSSIVRWSWAPNTADTKDHWKYTDCDSACPENILNPQQACPAGATAWSFIDTVPPSPQDCCDISGSTATLLF